MFSNFTHFTVDEARVNYTETKTQLSLITCTDALCGELNENVLCKILRLNIGPNA